MTSVKKIRDSHVLDIGVVEEERTMEGSVSLIEFFYFVFGG